MADILATIRNYRKTTRKQSELLCYQHEIYTNLRNCVTKQTVNCSSLEIDGDELVKIETQDRFIEILCAFECDTEIQYERKKIYIFTLHSQSICWWFFSLVQMIFAFELNCIHCFRIRQDLMAGQIKNQWPFWPIAQDTFLGMIQMDEQNSNQQFDANTKELHFML